MARLPWWSSFGNFEADASGLYPQARQVVAHYRCLSSWSRDQLAARLKIGTKALYYAEHEGRGLDSVARLRQLCALLQIPHALLGLCAAPARPGWWIAEYESWPAGVDGWPDCGSVVKQYRRSKQWTQGDLADALGIRELGVRKMEKNGSGLDLLTRRRALQFLLGVPPLLLGLDGAHGVPAAPALSRSASSLALPSLEELRSAQQRLWDGYYTGHGQDELQSVDCSLFRLKDALPTLPEAQRSAYIEQVSLLCQAAGNVSLAGANTAQVLSYMNTGIEYARTSEDADLLSTALGRRAAALWELGEQEAAEKSIREALSVASPEEKIKRYPVASRVLSCSAQDRTDRAEVLAMLDQIVINDRYQNGVDSNIILWCRAQVYTNLAQNAPNRAALLREAADLLERAERGAPDTLRRKLIIKLEQARAYLGLREYDYAVSTAIEAFQLMRQIKNILYLPQLSSIYHALLRSSASSLPQVARLGLLLFGMGVV